MVAIVQNLHENLFTASVFARLITGTQGTLGGTVVTDNALQAGRSRVRFPMVSREVFIDIILSAALWPWGVDSACNRNENEKYFLGPTRWSDLNTFMS